MLGKSIDWFLSHDALQNSTKYWNRGKHLRKDKREMD